MTIWTSRVDEQALIGRLASTGRLATSVIGESAGGEDLLAWRIGGDALSPPKLADPASLLYVGLQHGDEPAGREGLLALAQHLCDVHLDLPGTAGNYASTPDTSTLDITGDLVLRCGVLTNQWGVGGGNRYMISKYTTTGDQRSYALRIDTSGDLGLIWSTDGSSGGIVTATATALPTPSYYGVAFVAAELDVDDGAGNHTVTFYTAPSMDGPWTQLGDQVVAAGTTSIHSGSGVLEIGTISAGATSPWATQILAARVQDGIGGSVVADPDFTTQTVGASGFDDSTGKTWTVHGSAAIAAAASGTQRDFLDDHGLLLIPTVNPDGFPSGRLNANGVDINRHHLSLGQPEAEAVASVLASATPLVVADHHEFGSGFASEDVLFAEPRHPAAYSGIVASSDDLIDDLEARATAESWTFADYPASGAGQAQAQRLAANCGLRHSVAVLVETRETADDDAGQTDRTGIHYGLADEILAYVITNQATLATGQAAAQAAKAAEGAAGTTAYQLGGGDTIDPPPLGYLLTGVVPTLHLDLFGITATDDTTVAMGQQAQPVIPLLFDQDSTQSVATGIRLFSLAGPSAVATVQQLAPIVAGSHTVVFEARAVANFAIGPDPSGVSLEIVDGSVTLDGTADVQRSLDLTAIGHDLFPRRTGDTLLPDGTEIFVRRGVDIGSVTLWAPLGFFRIEAATQADAPDGQIRLVGYDRMKHIIDSQLLAPRQFSGGRTFGSVFGELIGEVFPSASIVFDDDLEAETIGRSLLVERSRYEPLRTLADGRGKVIEWDGFGLFRVRSAPDPTEPIWEVKSGRGGVLTTAQRQVTRTDVVNAVVVRSQGGDTLAPARAIAVDDGPQSITRFGGRFGEVPEYVTVPATSTPQQVADAARDILLRRAGLPHQIQFGAVPNPALVPYDPIRVTLRDGTRERHVVERLQIPLTARAAMTGTTREQRNTRVVIRNL